MEPVTIDIMQSIGLMLAPISEFISYLMSSRHFYGLATAAALFIVSIAIRD